jgi:PleD family two-component response regulator
MLTYSDVTDLVRNAERMEALATVDSNTGLCNRRHFLSMAEQEWSRFQRYHRPLSMLWSTSTISNRSMTGSGTMSETPP